MPCEFLLIENSIKPFEVRGGPVSLISYLTDAPVAPKFAKVQVTDADQPAMQPYMAPVISDWDWTITSQNPSRTNVRVDTSPGLVALFGAQAGLIDEMGLYLAATWGADYQVGQSNLPYYIVLVFPQGTGEFDLQLVKDDFMDKFSQALGMNRYRFGDADMDALAAIPNKTDQMTAAQIAAKFVDRLA